MGAGNSTPQTVQMVNTNRFKEIEITEDVLMRIQEEAKRVANKAASMDGGTTTTKAVTAAATTPPPPVTAAPEPVTTVATTTTTQAPTATPIGVATTAPATTTTTKPTSATTTTKPTSGTTTTKPTSGTTTTTKPLKLTPAPMTMPTLTLAAPQLPMPVQHQTRIPPQQQEQKQQQQQQQQQQQLQKQQQKQLQQKRTPMQLKTAEIEESHYNKTVEKVESMLGKPVYWSQRYGKEMQLLKGQLMRCYQENPTQLLRCSELSKEYSNFVFSKQYHTIVNMGQGQTLPKEDNNK